MADVTGVTGFKNYCASRLAASFYWVTLHGSGGSAMTSATTTYSGAGMAGELASGYGYVQGGMSAGSGTATNAVVDTPDVVWTATGGSIGPASFAALWANTTNTITSAQLVCVKDSSGSPQTATTGNTMTVSIANPITFT